MANKASLSIADQIVLFKQRGMLSLLFLTIVISSAYTQQQAPDKIAERFFMPALQMGYIDHNTDNISSGLIIQTSLDYRTKKGLLFRINFDDFSGKLNLTDAKNQRYSSRTPIYECIGGIGYRLTKLRNNFFLIAQTGIRFYENPVIKNLDGNINIEQQNANIMTLRYTFGYEYELFESIFVNTEIFAGHFYSSKDFWKNEAPHFGITLGISARLF